MLIISTKYYLISTFFVIVEIFTDSKTKKLKKNAETLSISQKFTCCLKQT